MKRVLQVLCLLCAGLLALASVDFDTMQMAGTIDDVLHADGGVGVNPGLVAGQEDSDFGDRADYEDSAPENAAEIADDTSEPESDTDATETQNEEGYASEQTPDDDAIDPEEVVDDAEVIHEDAMSEIVKTYDFPEGFIGLSAHDTSRLSVTRPILILMGSQVYLRTEDGREVSQTVGHPICADGFAFVTSASGFNEYDLPISVYAFVGVMHIGFGQGLHIGYATDLLHYAPLGLSVLAVSLNERFVLSDMPHRIETFFGEMPPEGYAVTALGSSSGLMYGYVLSLTGELSFFTEDETILFQNMIHTSMYAAPEDIGAALFVNGQAVGTLVFVTEEGAFFSAAFLYR